MRHEVIEEHLRRTARPARVKRPRAGPPAGVDLAPASTYEVVTRQMVEALADDLREIKGRLNGLLWMVAGAMLLELTLGLITGGG